MTVYLRRRATFSAAVSRPSASSAGIGHDYVVEVTVGGDVDPATGMVVNIKDVDAVLQERIVGPLHGKLLDRDLPDVFSTRTDSASIAALIWRACADAFAAGPALTSVRLLASPTVAVEVTSPNAPQKGIAPMFTLTRAYDFSASHRLHASELTDEENDRIFGKCNRRNGHGHNYAVEVSVAGDPDAVTGQIMDLDVLDRIVEAEVLDPFDHRHLNHDVPEFRAMNPTSENLTRVIWNRLARHQHEFGPARLFRVTVGETARNFFEYYGE